MRDIIKALLASIVTIAFLSGCAMAPPVETSGVDDDFSETISINTYGFSQPLMITATSPDWHIRGGIYKDTGETYHQVYAVTTGTSFKAWDGAVTLVNGDRELSEADRIAYDVDCSYGTCAHEEDVVISVSKELLEYWASNGGKVRMTTSSVDYTVDFEIDPEEVTAYLDEFEKNIK